MDQPNVTVTRVACALCGGAIPPELLGKTGSHFLCQARQDRGMPIQRIDAVPSIVDHGIRHDVETVSDRGVTFTLSVHAPEWGHWTDNGGVTLSVEFSSDPDAEGGEQASWDEARAELVKRIGHGIEECRRWCECRLDCR